MKEYIERNFALYVVKHFGGMLTWRKEDVISEIIRVLSNTPAADVVEVVRCKDCKYCIPAIADDAEYELCIVDNDVFPVSVQKQHFCGRGKRKEG